MLAVIPWGTDAPIYHFPWSTVGLIVITTVVFVITGPADRVDVAPVHVENLEQIDANDPQMAAKLAELNQKTEEEEEEEEESRYDVPRGLERWVLVYGEGLHPIQWITSNFIHGNIGHLLGNMLFLWSFGIIVEGKIGWWRFLLLYLSIGIGECATEQVLTLGASEGLSYGASAIVYGLLAISLVWAPKNDLNCWVFIWFFLRFHLNDYEIPIYWFAMFYIATEAITVPLSGFAMTSSILHLLGAAWGFGLGTLMLKANWVDCENWDLYAVIKGEHGKPKPKKKRKKKVTEEMDEEAKGAAALESLRQAIAEGHTGAALALYQKSEQTPGLWQTPETELVGLIKLLHTDKRFADSVPLMEQYIYRFPQKTVRVRLKLAQILIRDLQRPAHALRILGQIPAKSLPADLEQVRQQLDQKANQMLAEGVLELEGM